MFMKDGKLKWGKHNIGVPTTIGNNTDVVNHKIMINMGKN